MNNPLTRRALCQGIGAAGILAVSSFIASMVPARRAANVLPMTALRND